MHEKEKIVLALIYGLAVKSAMNQSTIRNFLHGKTNNVGIVTIKMICDGLDISLTEFFDKDVFKGEKLS